MAQGVSADGRIDRGLQQRIWLVLREGMGKSCWQIAEEVNARSDIDVAHALYRMRQRGCAAVTGYTWRAKWFRVPGAELPPDQTGKSPGSRGARWRGPKQKAPPKEPPKLDWASMLGTDKE